jgi:hypothetical protein
MEAYCNAARALEDKFCDIELNHVLCRYNEEAGELAKIASWRITVPSNVFARDVTRPSVNLEPTPSSQEEPSGAPSDPTGSEPMDEDPRTRRLYSPCSRDMAWTRLRPWIQSRSPARRTGETNTLPGWTEASFPRTDPRPDASPGWPSHSPSSMASCTSTPRQTSCSDVCPSLRGASSFGTFTRAYAATT